jgi:hypothetical protein
MCCVREGLTDHACRRALHTGEERTYGLDGSSHSGSLSRCLLRLGRVRCSSLIITSLHACAILRAPVMAQWLAMCMTLQGARARTINASSSLSGGGTH